MVKRHNKKVIVVGGGIFGLTGALELQARGWRVTLVDAETLPSASASSTDLSKVVRMDYGADLFLTELAAMAMSGWDAWNARWERPLFHQDGFLLLARKKLKPGGFEFESRASMRALGHDVEAIDSTSLSERFPHWKSQHWGHGYFNPRAGWAESGEVVQRLAVDARAAGVRIVEGARVLRVLDGDSGVRGVETEHGRTLAAKTVVVAAGPWTPSIVPELVGALSPIGQPVLHFQVADPTPWRPPHFVPWSADISTTGWYGFPATSDGLLKIAHHGQGLGIPPDPSASIPDTHIERCRGFLATTLPELVDAPVVGQRVCYYCDTFDGYFWIGRHPDRGGLVIASGGCGHGFKFAPLLGPMIANAVEGRSTRWSRPFAWRPFEGPIQSEDARYLGD